MGKTITPIGQSTGRTVSTVSSSGKTVTPIGGHAKKKKGGGGFLSHIPGVSAVSKVASQAGKDVYHAAVNSPAGLYYASKALGTDVGKGIENVPQNLAAGVGLAKPPKRSHQTADIVQAQVRQTAEDFKHPLRHPGLTGLDVLGIASLGAGGVARVGEAGRVARAGEGAGAVAKAAARGPKPGVRTFKVGDLETTKPASKAASTRAVQSNLDKRRNRAAAKNPGGRAARAVATKAGKAQEETLRIEQALATAPAAGLQAVGKRLKPHEQMALRVVAEEAPLEKRIAASRARQAAARSPLEARRHGRRVKLLEKARPLLTDAAGKPELVSPKLRDVYAKMQKVAGGREALGKQLGLLTDEMIQGRKTDAGRAAMGATYEAPTPAKLGEPSDALLRARSRVARLERLHGKAAERVARGDFSPMDRKRLSEHVASLFTDTPTVVRPRTEAEARTALAAIEKQHESLIAKLMPKGKLSPEELKARRGETMIRRRAGSGPTKRGTGFEPDALRTDIGGGRVSQGGYSEKETNRAGGGVRSPSIREEDRAYAEQQLEQLLRDHSDNPMVQRYVENRDLAAKLRASLNPLPGDPLGELGKVTATVRNAQVKLPSGKIVGPGGQEIVPRGYHTAQRLGAALSVAKDDLQSLERAAAKRVQPTGILGHEDFTASPSATYVPDVEQRTGRSGRIPSVGAQGTIGKAQSPIRYGYTGGAKAAAREPLDTTRAVAEGNLAVTKYARLVSLQKNLRKAASPTPRFRDDIAVRLDKIGAHDRLPADAKAFVNDPAQLERLTPDEQTSKLEQLRKSFILGNDKEISSLAPAQLAEFERLHAQGQVGWVPKKLLGDLANPAAPLSATTGKTFVSVVDAVNNATKLSVLYLKPAYAVPNLLGNLALNLVQQGFAAPVNLAKASRLAHTLGPELTAHVDTIMGEGFASALRGDAGHLSKATQVAANIWGKGVDKPFRRASFLHEAAREGFRTPAQVTKLLTSPELHGTLVDVAKRANREIIDYGRLSSKEREIVRRVVFFYPWLKGSTMYAGNLLMEHPVKAAAIGRLGVLGRERSQQELGPTPSFLEGAFKGPGGGLVNPTAAAILQTPAQVGAALAGLAGGNAPATGDLSQFLTPALSVALNKIAGQNLFTGQTYAKGHQGIVDVAKDTLVGSAPQTQLIEGLRGTSKSKLYPGSPRTAIGRYLLGGLYPRPYNPGRMHALARAEQRGK